MLGCCLRRADAWPLGGGNLPDVAAVFVDIRPAADALILHRGRIVGKRFPTGGDEILRSRERVVFATGDAIGQSVAEAGTPGPGGGDRSTRFLAIASMASSRPTASPPIRSGAARSKGTT